MWKIVPSFPLLFGFFLVLLDGEAAEEINNGEDVAGDDLVDGRLLYYPLDSTKQFPLTSLQCLPTRT